MVQKCLQNSGNPSGPVALLLGLFIYCTIKFFREKVKMKKVASRVLIVPGGIVMYFLKENHECHQYLSYDLKSNNVYNASRYNGAGMVKCR